MTAPPDVHPKIPLQQQAQVLSDAEPALSSKTESPPITTKRPKARKASSSTPQSDNQPTSFFKAYIHFLSLAANVHKPNQETDLDPNEKALLELMILQWSSGHPWTVRQAIAQAHLGSPATLHKRLNRLRTKSYCVLLDSADDRRIKYLIPGPKGMTYIESMGHMLMNAKRSAKCSTTEN